MKNPSVKFKTIVKSLGKMAQAIFLCKEVSYNNSENQRSLMCPPSYFLMLEMFPAQEQDLLFSFH